jgi:uncharacterized membrane protein YraQ (UPF0718 family)
MKRISLRGIFDGSFWVFAGLAAATGTACYLVAGPTAFWESFREDAELFILILPKLAAALLVAGFIQVLLPRGKVARWIGERSGLRGLAIASGAGMVTPGGPMTSFPLVNALHAAGTGRSALIAYLTSWSTLGLQRILSWELPLMGVEFALLRFLASLPLPFLAGMVSRWLPEVAIAGPLDDAATRTAAEPVDRDG